MIRFEMKNGMATTEANGGLLEIAGEIGVLINEIYSQISNTDARDGELFKLMMKALMTDTSPVWNKNAKSKDCTITKIDVKEMMKQMQEDEP